MLSHLAHSYEVVNMGWCSYCVHCDRIREKKNNKSGLLHCDSIITRWPNEQLTLLYINLVNMIIETYFLFVLYYALWPRKYSTVYNYYYIL